MNQRRAFAATFAWAMLLHGLALAAEYGTIVRVVDGDTIKVRIGRKVETIRLIGVDTPEAVDPRRPVQHFGREASAFVKHIADGERVRTEPDSQCSNRDKYRRLLRYVYLEDGTLLNAEIIAQGYGFAYTKYPFSRMEEFRRLEQIARYRGKGLWVKKSTQ